MLPCANACRMCNCHQTELLDQASKSVTPTLRTKKEKLLQETAENKPQTGVTFHWEETPARRNHTGKHHCWLPEGKLAIFTSDEGTGESRSAPCHTAPRPTMGCFNCFYTAGLGLKAVSLKSLFKHREQAEIFQILDRTFCSFKEKESNMYFFLMELLDCFQKEMVTVPLFWGKIPENMSKRYL